MMSILGGVSAEAGRLETLHIRPPEERDFPKLGWRFQTRTAPRGHLVPPFGQLPYYQKLPHALPPLSEATTPEPLLYHALCRYASNSSQHSFWGVLWESIHIAGHRELAWDSLLCSNLIICLLTSWLTGPENKLAFWYFTSASHPVHKNQSVHLCRVQTCGSFSPSRLVKYLCKRSHPTNDISSEISQIKIFKTKMDFSAFI